LIYTQLNTTSIFIPTADCTQAGELIADIKAQYLLADKGYDSNKIIKQALDQGMEPVIPPRKNRKIQRPYDVDSN
jgi:IS5 family transposase